MKADENQDVFLQIIHFTCSGYLIFSNSNPGELEYESDIAHSLVATCLATSEKYISFNWHLQHQYRSGGGVRKHLCI